MARPPTSPSLSEAHPELIEEWHHENERSPEQVSSGSGFKALWKCSACQHEWRVGVANRTRERKSGCPSCAGKAVHIDGRNSLALEYPDVASEFNLEKNAPLIPRGVVSGSHKRVWWKCNHCDHEWKRLIQQRTRNQSQCPACSGKEVHIDGRNSLANTHPLVAADFHSKRNSPLTPRDLLPGSSKRIWWSCKKCNHEWVAAVSARSGKRKRGCPFCAGQCIHSDGHNSLLVTHPELAKEMNPELNDGVGPDQIMSGSSRKRVWTCKTISNTPCGHIWITHPYVRTKGIGCPACANYSIHIDGRNSMRKTHPDLANEMHPTKNENMNPDNTITGTAKKIWWICKTISDTPCNHIWQTTGNSRASSNAGCPSCANQSIHIDGINSMRNTHPKLSEEFHPTKNGDYSPDNLIATTAEQLYWQCTALSAKPCGYIWKTRRVRRVGGGLEIFQCPACSNLDLHPDGRNSLAQLFPEVAKEFHPTKNQEMTPEKILPGSRTRIHWVCTTRSAEPCGHEWSTWAFKRTTGSETGCPACSKGGFDPSKPSQYYVIRVENENGDTILYKGGISNDFNKRFSQHKERFALQQRSSNWKLVIEEVSDFANGQDARDLETKLLGVKEIRAPNVADVSSELFIVNPLYYAREMGYIHR